MEKDLNTVIDEIYAALSNKDEEWDERSKALKRLQTCALTQGDDEEFAAGLERLKKPLLLQLEDLRSLVIKEAGQTLEVLSSTLKSGFDPYLHFFFPHLLRLTAIKTLAMSEPGHQALLALVSNCSVEACLLPVLQEAKDKNAMKRVRCMEYLSLLLQREGGEGLARHRETIADAIRAGLGDASPEARAFARSCYWAYHKRWEKHGLILLESLDPSAQKALARDRPSSSTSSKNSNATSRGGALKERIPQKKSRSERTASRLGEPAPSFNPGFASNPTTAPSSHGFTLSHSFGLESLSSMKSYRSTGDISDLVEKDKSDRPSFSALTKGVAPSSVSSVLRGGPTFPAPLNSSFGFASSGSDRAEEAGSVAKKRPPMRLGIRSGMRAQPAAGPHIPTEEELLAMLIPSSNKAPVSYPPAIQPLSSANPLQFPSGIVRPSFLDQSSTDSLLPSSTENAMSVSHESQNLPAEGISSSQKLVSIVAEVDDVTDEDMQTEASVSMVAADQSVDTATAPVAIVEEKMESSEIAAADSAPSPFVEEVAIPMVNEEEQSSPMTQQLRVLREVDTLLQGTGITQKETVQPSALPDILAKVLRAIILAYSTRRRATATRAVEKLKAALDDCTFELALQLTVSWLPAAEAEGLSVADLLHLVSHIASVLPTEQTQKYVPQLSGPLFMAASSQNIAVRKAAVELLATLREGLPAEMTSALTSCQQNLVEIYTQKYRATSRVH